MSGSFSNANTQYIKMPACSLIFFYFLLFSHIGTPFPVLFSLLLKHFRLYIKCLCVADSAKLSVPSS
ncbi:unnamed protein product [Meloidogyne enterolobii]|uniref:Uncharacterized protein n=1 Tax=Meloidogyne enterolobii TaxID=390850 RepID=A0ACB0YT63_MELEN